MKVLQLKSQQAGYTLVELLVALLVGAIFVSAATVLLTTQGRLTHRSRDLVVSNAFAEAKIESIRSAGYLALSDGTADITHELPSELNAPRSATLAVSSPSAALKQVVLTITYNEQGAPRTDTYTTYVGELGVGQY